jgi:hypothetical protein
MAPEQRAVFDTFDLVSWVSEHLGDVAIVAIVAATFGWVRREARKRPRRPPIIRMLYKPHGEVAPRDRGGSRRRRWMS